MSVSCVNYFELQETIQFSPLHHRTATATPINFVDFYENHSLFEIRSFDLYYLAKKYYRLPYSGVRFY